MDKIKVLFVCTGNIFRSMMAEYVMKKYLRDKEIDNIKATSAGTSAYPQPIVPIILEAMIEKGIGPRKHKQRKLNAKIIKDNDIIVSMADYHQEFILKNFKKESYLYNELAIGKKTSVLDADDLRKDWANDIEWLHKFDIKTFNHIYKSMPKFVEAVRKVRK